MTKPDRRPVEQVGLWGAVAYTLGDIIGSGIFVSPSSVLRHVDSVGASLTVWSVSAVVSLLGALCYVELGVAIPRNGNDFAYLTYAGWRYAAGPLMWLSAFLSYPATASVQMMTFGKYILSGLNVDLDASRHEQASRLLGYCALWPLLFINLFSLRRIVARFQILITISKIAVTLLIVGVGLYELIVKKRTENFHNAWANTTTKPDDFVLASYAGLFAYNGWDVLNFGTEEVSNPRRTLPLAALISIAISAGVFVFMNVAYFTRISVADFKSSDTIAVDFAKKTLGDFHYVVPFLIAVLLMGSLNSGVFASSRYLLAGCTEGVTPSFVAALNPKSASPRIAVIVVVVDAMLLTFVGSLDQLISYMMFAIWLQRTVTMAAFIWMRTTGRLHYPPNAFRVPLIVPILFFCLSAILLGIPVWQDFHVALYGLCFVTAGAVLFLLFALPKQLPSPLLRLNERVTVLTQLLFNVVPIKLLDSSASAGVSNKSAH